MTPLSLLTPLFLRHRYLPLPSVPYPPCSCRHCRNIARVCVCLSSAATSILVKPLKFYPSPCYLASCMAYLPSSYLRHTSISSSIKFAAPPQYFIPTPLPPPSLSTSLLYISIYLSIHIYIYLFIHICIYLSIYLLSPYLSLLYL